MVVCLRMLGSATSLHQLEDGACIGKETIRRYLRIFWKDLKEIYGPVFLNRRHTHVELDDMAMEYTFAGFPGCIGALDCMKIHSENCPSMKKGQYHNKKIGKGGKGGKGEC